MRKRDQFRGPREKRFVGVQIQQAGFGHRDEIQFDAALRLKHVPRDEVRVVLHLGQDDKVTGFEVRTRPCVSDQVDRFSGIARVNDLSSMRRIDELRDLLTRSFVQRGRLFGKGVHAAVNIGV